MLTLDGWVRHPVPLETVKSYSVDAPPLDQRALMRLAARLLPPTNYGRRFATYSDAMADLMKPRLFDNRISYRLVEAEWGTPPRFGFASCSYFDMLDVAEALSHELSNASDLLAKPNNSRRVWKALPLRSQLRADPLALDRRVILPSIGTLLLRRDQNGEATFLLHKRDSAAVAIAGNQYSLVPAGVFQPCSESPVSMERDLDLWRSIQRELNEEMLGADEARGDGAIPVDYVHDEPYASFARARSNGRLRGWFLGAGLDPLHLTLEFLTVLVIDGPVYDHLFRDAVIQNEEGDIVATGRSESGLVGFSFNTEQIDELARQGKLSAVADACLHVALRHRDTLLGVTKQTGQSIGPGHADW